MQANKQKLEEESFLKRFIELDNKSYESFELIQDDPPDAILKLKDQIISVEISKLFNKHGERVIQERKFVEHFRFKLKEESLNWKDNNFSVYWRFNFPFDFKKKERERIRDIMLGLAKAGLKKMELNSILEIQQVDLPSEIEHLSIYKSSNLHEPQWIYENYWVSGELSEEHLWHKINRKNQKALESKYFSDFAQNWLLLVIEEKAHSSFAGFADDGYSVKEDWIFDRIIIMEPAIENRLYHVK